MSGPSPAKHNRIAHRGATSVAPENTVAAFQAIVENRFPDCSGVELDVHSTRDGKLVVHHDSRMIDGRTIADSTAADIRESPLPGDHQIPLLEEVLELLGPIKAWIEAKGLAPDADPELLRILRVTDRIELDAVHSFDHRVIARLARSEPALELGVLSTSYPVDPITPALMASADILWQQWELIDEHLISRCASAGLSVVAWTAPSEAEARRLDSLGVSAVCIDL